MKTLNKSACYSFAVLALVMLASPALAQSADQHKHSDAAPANKSSDLGVEVRQLQVKVAELEAALTTNHRQKHATDGSSGGSTMKPMKKMGGMKKMNGMSKNSDGSMSVMGMGMKGNRMGMMPNMKGMMGMNPAVPSDSMAEMNMPSDLPGFPGASHLYHIGQTGFFLNHPKHITLTDNQRKKLSAVKEGTLLASSTAEREIAEAEQDLWKLTAADEPDIKKIEAKAKEIAHLQVSSRIAFIRSVGEAANVLTKEQREAFVGDGKK